MINEKISGFTILRLLGKGGMADVYYAENKLKRPAALKILHASLSSQPEVLLRFETEAQIMVSLDHPNIRRVYDVSEIDARPCIIMEYLEGYNLSEALHSKKLTDSQLAELWDHAIDGIKYAHQKGVVHRDIKPSNLFLTTSGQLKILDFGIAKVEEVASHTLTGQSLGTILYMSPEQVQDPKRVDYRSDIYSLGVTFYHLVTGKPPYDTSTDSIFNIQLKIVREALILDVLTPDWRSRLACCLTKTPKDRRFYGDYTKIAKPPVGLLDAVERMPVPREKRRISQKSYRGWAIMILGLITVICIAYYGYVYITDPLKTERQTELIKKLEQTYDWVSEFKNGVAQVKLNGKWGLIDKNGKILITPKYSEIYPLEEGLSRITENGMFGLLDNNGKQICPAMYDYIEDFSEGLAKVRINSKQGYIDKSGSEVIPLKYDFADNFSEGLAKVVLDSKHGYIDKSGSEVIPLKYDFADNFSEGLAKIMLDSKYGYIDKNDIVVIPQHYDFADNFSEGLAKVGLFRNQKIYNKGNLAEGSRFRFDQRWQTRYGYINKTGHMVIPINYAVAENFNNGVAFVKLSHDSAPFYINKNGECIRDCH
ncbi:MAG: WG repeat-containing protein [bacterium]|nr:WG repeat-containing protein [bacterium]